MSGELKGGLPKAPLGSEPPPKARLPASDTTSSSFSAPGRSPTQTPDQARERLDTLSGSRQADAVRALQASRGNQFTAAALEGACPCAACSDCSDPAGGAGRVPEAGEPAEPAAKPATAAMPAFAFTIGAPVGRGSVTASSLNVRNGPGTNYGKTGATLPQGSAVTIYGETGGWLCIGAGQWVLARYVAIAKAAAAPPPDLKPIVKDVWQAMFGGTGIGTDEEAVYSGLAKLNRDPSLITQFKALYRADRGTDVVADLESEFSNSPLGNELDKALGYLTVNVKPAKPAPAKGEPMASKKKSKTIEKKEAFYAAYYSMAVQSEKETGVPALFTLAQAALESTWGGSAYGNNFFGVKARASAPEESRQLLKTREVLKTPDKKFPEVISVTKRPDGKYDYVVRDWFRKYSTAAAGFADHGKFLRDNSRYKPAFGHLDDPYAFADAVAAAGYATDPGYAKKLKGVMRELEGMGASAAGKPKEAAKEAPADSKPKEAVKEASADGLTETILDALQPFLPSALTSSTSTTPGQTPVEELRAKIAAGNITFDSPAQKTQLLGENAGTKVSTRLQKLVCELSRLQSSIRISSVVRTAGHHGEGLAVDIGNESIAAALLPLIATDAKVAELGIDELIFDASVAGQKNRNHWNYDRGKKHDYGNATLNEHKNHIHIAVKPD